MNSAITPPSLARRRSWGRPRLPGPGCGAGGVGPNGAAGIFARSSALRGQTGVLLLGRVGRVGRVDAGVVAGAFSLQLGDAEHLSGIWIDDDVVIGSRPLFRPDVVEGIILGLGVILPARTSEHSRAAHQVVPH